MKTIPKFNKKNPSNKEEKLIIELISLLDETTHAFIKLNNPGNITHETFIVLRDGAIGYAGAMVRDIMKMLSNKNQCVDFLEEAKTIFNCYVDELTNK